MSEPTWTGARDCHRDWSGKTDRTPIKALWWHGIACFAETGIRSCEAPRIALHISHRTYPIPGYKTRRASSKTAATYIYTFKSSIINMRIYMYLYSHTGTYTHLCSCRCSANLVRGIHMVAWRVMAAILNFWRYLTNIWRIFDNSYNIRRPDRGSVPVQEMIASYISKICLEGYGVVIFT